MTTKVHRRSSIACAPLVPLALAAMGGVIVDRFADPRATSVWASVAIVAGALAAIVGRWGNLAFPALVVAFAALGGGWHHHQWSDLALDDLARGDWSTPHPAWVRGVLVGVPEFRKGDQPDDRGLTRTVMAATAIRDGQAWRAASGRLDVSVSGERADLAMGDPVMAAGMLGEVAGPLNPGETDRRDSLRARGVRLRMTVGEPMSLWPDPQRPPWPWHQWLGVMRSRSQARLVRRLDPAVAPLASALLLGRREAVDPDVNDAFARTGTTHLLAISGLHLQALAAALWMIFRTLGTGRKPALLGVAAATVAYAILVGGMPSVVRSAAMTVAICLAGMRDRRVSTANLLAAAALATLAMNPAHLFDVGCQLSFLCIAAVFWGVPPAARCLEIEIYYGQSLVDLSESSDLRSTDPLKALERRYESFWKRLGRRLGTWLVVLLITSAVVWLTTLPLVMLRFHLISPIGVLLNVPLIPTTSMALLLAGLTLLASAWGPLGTAAALACSGNLKLAAWLVRWGGSRPWGHQFAAGPTWTWVLIAYGLLALAVAAGPGWRRWTRGALGVWLVLGLVSSMVRARPVGLEVEVFAVGHGLSVLIQGSDGRSILYDCGRMRDPHVGRRLIAPALWARGVRRLDLVILSHADADHYNGLPDLLERFPIGEVRVPPGFDRDLSAALVLKAAWARDVQVRPIVAGDRLDVGQGATLLVLHPPEDWPLNAPDNAHSVVLDLASEGRRMLLTGDLEGVGQAALTGQPPRRLDALLAPHHGGRSANPPWFYRWAEPPLIVVSQRRPVPGSRDPLDPPPLPSARVLRTWQGGAIRFRWTSTGLAAESFLDHDAERNKQVGGIENLKFKKSKITEFKLRMDQIAFSTFGILFGLTLCGTLAVIEWGAWALVRPGRRLQPPAPEPPPWEPIEATAADGVRLRGAWQRAAVEASGRTVVLLHGFAEDRSALQGRAESLLEGGWNVALIDARGRGQSDGDLISFGGREADDLRAWIDALTPFVGSALTPVLWGRSMGAAIALRAALIDPRIRALVLEAPYADLRPAVATWLRALRIPGLLAGPLLRRAERLAGVALHRPGPIDLAPEAALPVLILHGEADPVVSLSDVRRLASAFPTPPSLFEVPEARHGDVFDLGGPDLSRRILEFLNGAVPLPTLKSAEM